MLRTEDLDGFKFFLDATEGKPAEPNAAEAWLLIRGSGTEPLLRVYCEAGSQQAVEAILSAALEFVHQRG